MNKKRIKLTSYILLVFMIVASIGFNSFAVTEELVTKENYKKIVSYIIEKVGVPYENISDYRKEKAYYYNLDGNLPDGKKYRLGLYARDLYSFGDDHSENLIEYNYTEYDATGKSINFYILFNRDTGEVENLIRFSDMKEKAECPSYIHSEASRNRYKAKEYKKDEMIIFVNDNYEKYPDEYMKKLSEVYNRGLNCLENILKSELNMTMYDVGFYSYNPVPEITEGLKSDDKGKYFQNADGSKVKDSWKEIEGKWYHFNSNCYMDTSKWIGDYYVKSDGVMATSEWIGNYYVDASGKWDPSKNKVTTGWKSDNVGKWYVNANGSYPVNKWQEIDGKWYHFDSRGYMESNKWIGNYWLLSNGQMATSQWVDGDKYYVGADGAWDSSKKKIVTGWKSDNVGKWYVNSNGSYPVSKWQQIDGDWYHFDSRGYMESNKWIGNYWLLSNGKMATSQWVDNNRYYVGSDGAWVPGK